MLELLRELIEGYLRQAGLNDEEIEVLLRKGPLIKLAKKLRGLVAEDQLDDLTIDLEW